MESPVLLLSRKVHLVEVFVGSIICDANHMPLSKKEQKYIAFHICILVRLLHHVIEAVAVIRVNNIISIFHFMSEAHQWYIDLFSVIAV